MIFPFARAMICIAFLSTGLSAIAEIHLTDAQALAIGKRIWKNECAGTVSGLTSWNSGEAFASLGIGHFIWYPAGKPGPFEESFPKLVVFLNAHGQKMPSWTGGHCPWFTRAEFQRDADSPRMKELRTILAGSVGLQARFAAQRLEQSLDKMLHSAPALEQQKIRTNFNRVAAEPMGLYALMDYVNFKGE
ncbi:MAG: hypothetical protein ABIP97_02720, partial [Chthoniobacterales bacterium]